MAGRVQIATLGDSLSVKPSFSYFTTRYSKYTNHAHERYGISFPEKVFTNDRLDVPLPQKYGDILQGITLSFVVEPGNVGSNLYPIDVFGISVIDYVELYLGDTIIDTVTSDDIFIERELNLPESYRSSVDVIHGKHFQGSSDGEFLQEFYDGQYSIQGVGPFTTSEYRIQIPFYFHRRPAHGFPLCALRNQELSLRIQLRPATDVLFTGQEKFGDTLWDPRANNALTEQLELSDFKVNLELIHLNTTERCMLQNRDLDIVFEQRQRNIFRIDPQSKKGTFTLDFKNCVKELFFIAKKTGVWTDEYVSILDELHTLDRYTETQERQLTTLSLIPVWGGVIRSALDMLVGETNRDTLVDTILKSIHWGDNTVHLEALRNPDNDPTPHLTILKAYIDSIPITVTGVQISAATYLNALVGETDENARASIIDTSLLNIEKLWGPEQIGILQLLKTPGLPQEALLIFGLRVYLSTVSYYLSGLSDLRPGTPEQIAVVTTLISFLDNTKFESDIIKSGMSEILDNIPGKSEYMRARIVQAILKFGDKVWEPTHITLINTLLEDPGSDQYMINQQTNDINTLKAYLQNVYLLDDYEDLREELGGDASVQFLVYGMLAVLGTYFPDATADERDETAAVIRQTPIWGDDIIKQVINYSPSEDPPTVLLTYLQGILGAIPTLKVRLNALKAGISGLLDTLPSTAVERESVMYGIATLAPWSDQGLFYIEALRTQSDNDATYINALKQENVPNIDGYTQFDQNNIIDGILPQNIWGEYYYNLNDLRLLEPGSDGHADAIDVITGYLDTLAAEIFTPPAEGLLFDIYSQTGSQLQDSDIKVNAWGGYFYHLIEDLRNPDIVPDTETDIIEKLKTYVNLATFSDTANRNIQFLMTQLTVAYPVSIFNKWVRAKKNVPLIYSKQKTTTLECDGVKIIDETTGSNMFLSASLPNTYHKRSPNFRNINMYSFAMYPGELRPSGHLNFSTIKNAKVTMDLEYDGRHGTFDFDDNYISLFGIDPMYFPKQVIIIAKSYNVMYIRDGHASIIY